MKVHAMIRVSALVAGLGAAASGQGAASGWEKMAIPGGDMQPDSTLPPGVPGASKGPILAVDGGGRIYVNDGAKLHIGSQGGDAWTTVEKPLPDPRNDPYRPLAAGGSGTVQWGEWRSRDGGAAWDSADAGGVYAFGVPDDGTLLRARPYDIIERRAGNAGDWSRVHAGRTYGTVTRFDFGRSGLAFALPLADTLLCSLDSGKTWDWGRWWPAGSELSGRTIRAYGFEHRMSTPLLLAVRKNGDGTGNRLVRLHVYYTALDTLEDAVLPDSAITALHVGGDGSIWLGTGGQGVWTAAAGSRTFAARNGGLGSLHVTSLAAASDGTLFARTRDGVYRARDAATGLLPLRAARSQRPPSGTALHVAGFPGMLPTAPGRAPARLRVLADGRRVSAPDRPSGMP